LPGPGWRANGEDQQDEGGRDVGEVHNFRLAGNSVIILPSVEMPPT